MDGILKLSSVLSITHEALRIQADRTQMQWEADRSCMLRTMAHLQDEIRVLKQPTRSPPTPLVLESPVSAVMADEGPAPAREEPEGQEELVQELRRCRDENSKLTRKNDTLKHNFFFLEDKYKKLRSKLQDVVQDAQHEVCPPAAAAPRSDKKRSAAHIKEENAEEKEASSRVPKRRHTEILPGMSATSSSRPVPTSKDSRALRRVQTAPLAHSNAPQQPRVDKYTEVVRNKAERAALAGHTCDECRQFYGVLMEQGFITASQLPGYLQECSRHKAKFSPDKTPEGFWDDENFSMPTPEEQQKRQCAATHARALTQMSQKGAEA